MKTKALVKCLFTALVGVGLVFQTVVIGFAQEEGAKPSIDVSKVRVPEIYGTIKEVHKGGDNVIFYLQDAHCNLEAQRNNARILNNLIGQYDIDTVCMEGAAGPCKTEWLKAYKGKPSMRDAATYFMRHGKLSGPEFLLITGDTEFDIIGLEDKTLFDKNKKALLKILPMKDASVAQLNQLEGALNKIADKTYSKDLKDFVSAADYYRDGRLKFTEFAQVMREAAKKHGVDIAGYENFALQGKTFDMEAKIDFDAVEGERASVVDELSKKLSKDDASKLVTDSLAFRLGRMNAVEYYNVLKGYCGKAGIDLKDKANLVAYIDYINLFDKINKDALVNEANAVRDAIKDKLFANNTQRELDKDLQFVDSISRMFNVKLGIRDYNAFKKSSGDMSIDKVVAFIKTNGGKAGVKVPSIDVAALKKNQGSIEEFYAIANERDQVLAKNAVDWMKNKKLDRMAIVTGGFHTPEVVNKLKKAGYSLVVITPRITDFNVKSPYMNVIEGKKTPFELMIDGELVEGQTLKSDLMVDEDMAKPLINLAAVNAVVNSPEENRDGEIDGLKRTIDRPGAVINSVMNGIIYQDKPGGRAYLIVTGTVSPEMLAALGNNVSEKVDVESMAGLEVRQITKDVDSMIAKLKEEKDLAAPGMVVAAAETDTVINGHLTTEGAITCEIDFAGNTQNYGTAKLAAGTLSKTGDINDGYLSADNASALQSKMKDVVDELKGMNVVLTDAEKKAGVTKKALLDAIQKMGVFFYNDVTLGNDVFAHTGKQINVPVGMVLSGVTAPADVAKLLIEEAKHVVVPTDKEHAIIAHDLALRQKLLSAALLEGKRADMVATEMAALPSSAAAQSLTDVKNEDARIKDKNMVVYLAVDPDFLINLDREVKKRAGRDNYRIVPVYSRENIEQTFDYLNQINGQYSDVLLKPVAIEDLADLTGKTDPEDQLIAYAETEIDATITPKDIGLINSPDTKYQVTKVPMKKILYMVPKKSWNDLGADEMYSVGVLLDLMEIGIMARQLADAQFDTITFAQLANMLQGKVKADFENAIAALGLDADAKVADIVKDPMPVTGVGTSLKDSVTSLRATLIAA